jgi:hypothetical protein
MKKKLIVILTAISLFSLTAITSASPNFNNPAEETGILHLFGDDDFYINGYEIEDLSKAQKHQLRSLVGKTITIKGFYENEFLSSKIDEIYVTEIIPH